MVILRFGLVLWLLFRLFRRGLSTFVVSSLNLVDIVLPSSAESISAAAGLSISTPFVSGLTSKALSTSLQSDHVVTAFTGISGTVLHFIVASQHIRECSVTVVLVAAKVFGLCQ